MAANTIKARVTWANALADVLLLIRHPMENGQRKDERGAKLPAHFITELFIEHNQEEILRGDLGGGVAKNPTLRFQLTAAQPGDTLRVTWRDNQDDTDTLTITL